MGPPFDFDEVFDEDYLFFYEPGLAEVAEADVDRLMGRAGRRGSGPSDP